MCPLFAQRVNSAPASKLLALCKSSFICNSKTIILESFWRLFLQSRWVLNLYNICSEESERCHPQEGSKVSWPDQGGQSVPGAPQILSHIRQAEYAVKCFRGLENCSTGFLITKKQSGCFFFLLILSLLRTKGVSFKTSFLKSGVVASPSFSVLPRARHHSEQVLPWCAQKNTVKVHDFLYPDPKHCHWNRESSSRMEYANWGRQPGTGFNEVTFLRCSLKSQQLETDSQLKINR